jgi:carbon monoxide dehydrogenase subunit G
MAHITGHIRIAAPVEQVFDTVADSRNEPSFNPAMTGVELLTPPPIGLGTRFRARMGKAGMAMLVELTEFDRPRRLGSRTTSSMMQTSGTLTFAAEGEDTIMCWDWQVRPKGWLRMLGPLSGPLGGRMERKIWTGLTHQLEDSARARPADRTPPSHALEDRAPGYVQRAGMHRTWQIRTFTPRAPLHKKCGRPACVGP